MEREPEITHLLVVCPSALSSLSFESIHVSMYSTLPKNYYNIYIHIITHPRGSFTYKKMGLSSERHDDFGCAKCIIDFFLGGREPLEP